MTSYRETRPMVRHSDGLSVRDREASKKTHGDVSRFGHGAVEMAGKTISGVEVLSRAANVGGTARWQVTPQLDCGCCSGQTCDVCTPSVSGKRVDAREATLCLSALAEAERDARVLSEFEREFVLWLLTEHQGNVAKGARSAGMDRKHLRDLSKKHNLLGCGRVRRIQRCAP